MDNTHDQSTIHILQSITVHQGSIFFEDQHIFFEDQHLFFKFINTKQFEKLAFKDCLMARPCTSLRLFSHHYLWKEDIKTVIKQPIRLKSATRLVH